MSLARQNRSSSVGAPPRQCLCAGLPSASRDTTPRCPACVQRLLKPHLDRHAQALKAHERAKEDCRRELLGAMGEMGDGQSHQHHHRRLSELQCESQQLRDRLVRLRKECADLAVRVASKAVENDTVRDQLLGKAGNGSNGVEAMFDHVGSTDHVSRLQESVLRGSLAHAQILTSAQVRMLRFQWARKALHMHRLDVGSDAEALMSSSSTAPGGGSKAASPSSEKRSSSERQRNQRRAQGIGKIGGLPLPHAGPELYGVLPPLELQSALRLVASVTSIVARCLGIVLPHPILLTPDGSNGDIVETVNDDELREFQKEYTKGKQSQAKQQMQQPVGSSSTSSILSLMDGSSWKRSAKNAIARATGQQLIAASTRNTFVPPSMDVELVSERLQHATAAVLAESTDVTSSSSKFSLSMEGGNGDQDGFAIALQFLQNDIITLCIRAGVPVSNLWPAEAVLLNLRALMIYCEEQTAAPY